MFPLIVDSHGVGALVALAVLVVLVALCTLVVLGVTRLVRGRR